MKKEEVQKKICEMQKLYSELNIEIEQMKEFEANFNNLQSRMDKLITFYQNEWLDFLDCIETENELLKSHYESLDENEYSILSEDTVWNLLTSYEEIKRNILKKIVNSM